MSQDKAQRVANILEPYTHHKPSCSYERGFRQTPDGDFCDCGLGEAVEEVREILDE